MIAAGDAFFLVSNVMGGDAHILSSATKASPIIVTVDRLGIDVAAFDIIYTDAAGATWTVTNGSTRWERLRR